ncbi:MAG: hypothetical protein AABW91_00280 [Nanoarchaeota archaeon]
MKTWLKGGLILGIMGALLYIILNIIFILSGNPKFQVLVDLNILKNIIPFIGWTLIGFILGAIIGLIIGLIIQKVREKKKK